MRIKVGLLHFIYCLCVKISCYSKFPCIIRSSSAFYWEETVASHCTPLIPLAISADTPSVFVYMCCFVSIPSDPSFFISLLLIEQHQNDTNCDSASWHRLKCVLFHHPITELFFKLDTFDAGAIHILMSDWSKVCELCDHPYPSKQRKITERDAIHMPA